MVLLDTWERKNCASSIVETKLSAFSTIGKQSFCFQQTRAITTPLGLSTFHLGLLFYTTCDLLSLWKGEGTFSAFNPAAFVNCSHYSHYCTFSEQFLLLPLWLQALILIQFFWDNTATIFPLSSVTPSTCKGHGLQISSVNFLSLVSQLLAACWLPTYLQLSNKIFAIFDLAIGVRASILSQHPTEPAAPFNKFLFFNRCRIVLGGMVPIPMNVIADEWLTVRLMPHWVDQLERKDPKWHSRGAKVSSKLEKPPLCYFLLPLNNTT